MRNKTKALLVLALVLSTGALTGCQECVSEHTEMIYTPQTIYAGKTLIIVPHWSPLTVCDRYKENG